MKSTCKRQHGFGDCCRVWDRISLRPNDQIEADWQLGLLTPERFADEPFPVISDHCIT